MSRRLVHRAAADAFVRVFMRASLAGPKVAARAVIDKCATWCAEQHLLKPSASEIAEAMIAHGGIRLKSNGQRLWRGVSWRDEPEPFNALAEPDVLRRLIHKSAAIPLSRYCRLVGIARSTFYAQQSRGDAPPTFRRSNRIFIEARSAMEWCVARDMRRGMFNVMDWVDHLDAAATNRARGDFPSPR